MYKKHEKKIKMEGVVEPPPLAKWAGGKPPPKSLRFYFIFFNNY
jgi:hypothetical protein